MSSPIDTVGQAIPFLIALILSISVHEFGHAWAANRLGDPLPRLQGRLTLLPTRHIDPIGTLLFPLIAFFTALPLLGWGKPVMTNPSSYTRRFSRTTGSMLVAVAGPAMNLVMAFVVSLVLFGAMRTGIMSEELGAQVFRYLIALNLLLMFFNLIPIPPLDGGAVLAWVMPRSMQGVIDLLNRWGFIILFGLFATGVLSFLMTPAAMVEQAWFRILWGLATR